MASKRSIECKNLKSKRRFANIILNFLDRFSYVRRRPVATAWTRGTTPTDVYGISHTIWIRSTANLMTERYGHHLDNLMEYVTQIE